MTDLPETTDLPEATDAASTNELPEATHLPEPGRTWRRYVAIGDSFTEGMSDPDPTRDNAYIGWADRTIRGPAQQRDP